MKLLFVDLKYDYGNKSRGINLIGEHGFRKSFEKLNFQVDTFYYDEYLNNKNQLQSDLLKYAQESQPDIIFFMLFEKQFELSTLQELKRQFVTVNWFGDDTWRFDNFSKHYAPTFTYSITTDRFSLEKYKTLDTKVLYSQWAAIDDHEIPTQNSEYKYDISFVGQAQPYRKWFINEINKLGHNVSCFGMGWPNGPLSFKEMNEVFANSKINLNISNSSSFDLRYLTSSVKGLLMSLRGKKSRSQIKARNFEINYFGGFQLTDWVPSMDEYYHIGQDIACYNSLEEAGMLIHHYLINNGEREAIKNQGHERAKNEHGYIHRLKKVFESIDL